MSETVPEHGLASLPLAAIMGSKTDSQAMRRARFDAAALEELATSIAEHGVLQPIIVRPALRSPGLNYLASDPDYELVAGERRYLAAKLASLETIPAVVRAFSDQQVLEVQLIENLQRADLHPLEEAEGYEQLMKTHGFPMEELHARVGKSKSYVYGRLKLLALTPKARQAFYAGTISASIALLVARIPVPALQDEALVEITAERAAWLGEMTFSKAREFIRDHYTLLLQGAPFPVAAPDLPGGPCGVCPKRTGNQPELFGDVPRADVCTDPECFHAKTKAHGDRRIVEAKAAGQPVITGRAAEKVWKYAHSIDGYTKLDEHEFVNGKRKKVRTLVGTDAEITLIQDPRSGEAVEVVKRSVVDAALRKARKEEGRSGVPDIDGTLERQRKAKLEKRFRVALYERLRAALPPPTLREIAERLYRDLPHDDLMVLRKLPGYDAIIPMSGVAGVVYRDDCAVDMTLESLEQAGRLNTLITDCLYVRELVVPTWSDAKPERLLDAAKAQGIDVAAVRRSVARKKKNAKKKAAKKASRIR